ncbi:MAG: uL15m family ribosomal protein [Candidatus Micrarchaeota archaeon]
MARRTRSKTRKFYGNRTFGGGNTKNRRGKGSRGGVGRAGFHKHKRLQYIVNEGPAPLDSGFVNDAKKKVKVVGLNVLAKKIIKGLIKPEGSQYRIDLREKGKFVKLLGNGEFIYNAVISVDAFSASAKEKVEKAGGKIVLPEKKAEEGGNK